MWDEAALPAAAFGRAADREVVEAIRREHEEAASFGADGVPALRRADSDVAVVGAHPEALYRRWIERSLERGEGLVEAGAEA